MARYIFQANYHNGTIAIDDIGEEFATPQEAEAHGIIAYELGRN